MLKTIKKNNLIKLPFKRFKLNLFVTKFKDGIFIFKQYPNP